MYDDEHALDERQAETDLFRCKACGTPKEDYWPRGRCLVCEAESPPTDREAWARLEAQALGGHLPMPTAAVVRWHAGMGR